MAFDELVVPGAALQAASRAFCLAFPASGPELSGDSELVL
jgi:hypothetical protein